MARLLIKAVKWKEYKHPIITAVHKSIINSTMLDKHKHHPDIKKSKNKMKTRCKKLHSEKRPLWRFQLIDVPGDFWMESPAHLSLQKRGRGIKAPPKTGGGHSKRTCMEVQSKTSKNSILYKILQHASYENIPVPISKTTWHLRRENNVV